MEAHEQRGRAAWGWKPQSLHHHAALSGSTFLTVARVWSHHRDSQHYRIMESRRSIPPDQLSVQPCHFTRTERGGGGTSCSQPPTAALRRSWDYHAATPPFLMQSLSWVSFQALPSTLTPRRVVPKLWNEKSNAASFWYLCKALRTKISWARKKKKVFLKSCTPS